MSKRAGNKQEPNHIKAGYQEKSVTNGFGFFANTGLQSVLFFIMAFLLYANTLGHDFVLDDFMVIKKNAFTQKGLAGIWDILTKDTFFGFFEKMKEDPNAQLVTGGRYRPFSLVCFAIIFQIFGENAFIFHLFTVLMYALTGVVLYRTLLLLITPKYGTQYASLFSWLVTLLYIAHPVHTEVVANIKGCDEIFAFLGSIATLYGALKAYDTGNKGWITLAFFTFLAAVLSKENAVMFLLIIPMAVWFFRTSEQTHTGRKTYRTLMGAIFGAFALFFVLRGNALNWQFGNDAPFELMNNPFLKIGTTTWIPFSPAEKLATVFVTLLHYIGLLVFPITLTHDYYPRQIDIMTFGHPLALLSLLVHVGLGIYALTGLAKKDIIRFGILYYLITLSIVSNLIFSVGTLMNERFLYMPSLGFCMILGVLLLKLSGHISSLKSGIAVGMAVLIAALFSFKTISRNPDWKTNEILFLKDVEISVNSAKAHDDAGGVVLNMANAEKDKNKKNELLRRAIKYFDKALDIHPSLRHAIMNRADCYNILKEYDKAEEDLRKALQYWPTDRKVIKALAQNLRDFGNFLGKEKGDPERARKYLIESHKLNGSEPQTVWLLGVSYAKQNQYDEAILWFEKAVNMKPEDAGYLYDLGTSYYRKGNNVKGAEYHAKAKTIDPEIGIKRGAQK